MSFFGLNTALSGLTAHQRALDVTAHNIGNVSTPGYSRQEATIVAARPMTVEQGALNDGRGAQIGAGVDIASYRRIRDGFLDLQYRAQQMQLGDSAARSRSLEQVEVALGEPGDLGLSTQLQRFWSAWSDLASNPSSPAAKTAVVAQAEAITTRFADLDGQLGQVQAQAGARLSELMAAGGDIQTLARQIASLNDDIHGATIAGIQPNDLLDRRDALLDTLSRFAQIRVADDPARVGAVDVFFGDVGASATPLVDGATPGTGAVAAWPYPLPAAPGGELGALAAMASTSGPVAEHRATLATLARTFADQVNAAYTAGGTISGDFFRYTAGNEAATLAVVATAETLRTGTGAAGDGSIAAAVAAQRNVEGGVDRAYGAWVTQIGEQVRAARRNETSAQALTDSVEARRLSTAGVSLDEEMANLIRFQRGYQASARVMSTVDEILDVLVNRTGRVGL